jgi:hypothetical protein
MKKLSPGWETFHQRGECVNGDVLGEESWCQTWEVSDRPSLETGFGRDQPEKENLILNNQTYQSHAMFQER